MTKQLILFCAVGLLGCELPSTTETALDSTMAEVGGRRTNRRTNRRRSGDVAPPMPDPATPASPQVRYERLPQFDPGDEERTPVSGETGEGWEELHTFERDGVVLFEKTSSASIDGPRETRPSRPGLPDENDDRDLRDVVMEAEWYERLGDMEFPRTPAFHGTYIDENGHYVLIAEYVEGTHINSQQVVFGPLPDDFRVTPEMIAQLERDARALEEAGIGVADLQYRVTPDGDMVLVDPERFADYTGDPKGWTLRKYQELIDAMTEYMEAQTEMTDGADPADADPGTALGPDMFMEQGN